MPLVQQVKKLLEHPATRGLDINDPRTTQLRRGIVEGNRFLWRIYDEWYRTIASRVPDGPGRVFELGSGAGFLRRYIPDLITSEMFPTTGIDLILDARDMPFASGSLKAIAMVDVMHHIPDVRLFLNEAQRTLRPGGGLLMIEPWVSTWSRLIYTHLHHEPFDPAAQGWTFPESGPLSGANVALPWIVFKRDRVAFEAEFPGLQIEQIFPSMPFRYLVSGGVSMRPLMPEMSFGLWKAIESSLERWPTGWPMFAFIHLKRF
jgi:SAM-dependent methyltransferase